MELCVCFEAQRGRRGRGRLMIAWRPLGSTCLIEIALLTGSEWVRIARSNIPNEGQRHRPSFWAEANLEKPVGRKLSNVCTATWKERGSLYPLSPSLLPPEQTSSSAMHMRHLGIWPSAGVTPGALALDLYTKRGLWSVKMENKQ